MKKLLLITLLSAPAFAETPHCVTVTNEMLIVTQCDNGTVSVTNSKTGMAVICSSGTGADPRCEKVNTNDDK
ncbi:hypothetical protein [Serratia marcescens]|uniref:Uncharacterized protein n=1 Tax=Serratia marcescens TaxID=615 RepID=A0A9X8VEM0_SERMA|nr:hypothetical protein [Serratia marcescens]MBS3895007.1 hypothetical protein [Serratia marcescens]